MKKREFLTQGGVLASGMLASPWVSASAPASSTAHTPSPPASPSEAQSPQGLGAWQARLGERFETLSTLGRDVTLQLVEALPLEGADSDVEQFRLSFMGPRHLPLGEGLHTLRAQRGDAISLHLQPVRTADGLRYLAHFSLLS